MGSLARRRAVRTVVRPSASLGPGAANVAAVAVGASLVLSVGLTDGGYYLRVATALSVAFVACAVLGALTLGRVSVTRAGGAAAVVLVLLTAWSALSAVWAVEGALVGLEVRRGVLYTTALVAALVMASGGRGRAFVTGLLVGLVALGVVSIAIRTASGAVVDRYYGTLLEEPVGYPNALGVLAALGVVLAVGLETTHAVRAARAASAFLVLVLGLSGSRGAALALAVAVVVLAWLVSPARRWPVVWSAATAIVVGGAGWLLASEIGVEGSLLVVAALVVAGVGALVPGPPRAPTRRVVVASTCVALVVAAGVLAVAPVSTGSSFRTDYWKAALGGFRGEPLLGTGAGSFHLIWRAHGPEALPVRDAHSLYVETLGELGPLGLGLVLALVAIPLAAAVRGRHDPTIAVAGGGFALVAAHAAVDWDWEMPVVILAALGCAAVVMQQPSGRRPEAEERRT